VLVAVVLAIGATSSVSATERTVCSTGCTHATIQEAIDNASGGDVIKLQSGTVYTENVILKKKDISTYIVITTDADPATLPTADSRINPTFAERLPKIQSPGAGLPTIATENGAHHYKFSYIEFPSVPQGFNAMVLLGDGESEFETDEPSDIVIDHCYFHGDAVVGQKRGAELHGKRLDITNSYFEQIVAVGQDSQCIVGYNGHGPYQIVNNYLECGTENVMFGGADPHQRTYLRATGSPTTTQTGVLTVEPNHTITEIHAGQPIAIRTTSGSLEYTRVASVSGVGTSGTLTFNPALTTPPAVPGELRTGVVASGLTFRRNHVVKKLEWRAGVLATPTDVSAGANTGSGSLSAGTRYYKVQAFSSNGFNGAWVNGGLSDEAGATLGATGSITLTWSAVAGATMYRVWRATTAGGENEWTDAASTSFVDDGSVTWATDAPSGATHWQIKNLFEAKALQDSHVDSNIFENQWKGVDIGFSFWLKSVNQDGACWWCQSRNIIIENNIIRHQDGWLILHGQESEHGEQPPPMTDIVIRNNLVYDSSHAYGDGNPDEDAYAMSISDSVQNTTIAHNTVVHTMKGLLAIETSSPGLTLKDNLLRLEFWGIKSSDSAGTEALEIHAPGYTFTGNAIAGDGSGYPSGNTYESVAGWENEFVAYTATGDAADYHLRPTSALRGAGTDGKDVGADIDLILAVTAGVESGSGGGAPPPSTWTGVDIGEHGTAGSSSETNGVWTVSGVGADIWGTQDAFRYVHRQLSGDGSVTVRVDSFGSSPTPDPFAKAGVMLRADTTAGAKHAIFDVRPTGDLEFMVRTNAGDSTTFLAGATIAMPVWLRLSRSGTSITATYSTDGSTWIVLATTSVALPASASAGIVVSSHDASTAATATFRGLSVLSGQWLDTDVGATGLVGNAAFDGTSYTIAGGGADIWDSEDSFHYVYRTLSGNGAIVLRVSAIQNTDPFAKVGVMMRDGLTTSAPHVLLDFKPNGEVEFMQRSAAGNSTTYLGGVPPGPQWLRLTRTATSVTADYSSDGMAWLTVGVATVGFGATVDVGVAVCSHDITTLNVATLASLAVQ